MRRILIVLLLGFAWVNVFCAKKTINAQNTIYIDYALSQACNEEIGKKIISQVLKPYYREHNCLKADKKNPYDIRIIVHAEGTYSPFSKPNILNYQYLLTYRNNLDEIVGQLRGSFKRFALYSFELKAEIPNLKELSIRSLVPYKDVAITEDVDLRRLGIAPPKTDDKKSASYKKPEYSYYIDLDLKKNEGIHAGRTESGIRDFLDEIKKVEAVTFRKTENMEDADIILRFTLLASKETKGNRKSVRYRDGQEYYINIPTLTKRIDYQFDVLIPHERIYNEFYTVASFPGSTSAVADEPVKYLFKFDFDVISMRNFATYAQLGHDNRIARFGDSQFYWLGSLIPDDKEGAGTTKAMDVLSSDKAFDQVTQLAQQYLNDDFLAPRPPIDIAAMVPPKVVQDTLPPCPVLEKDQFETTLQFEQRVAKAEADRQAKVNVLAAKYEKETLARNAVLEKLSTLHESDLACIEEEQALKQQNLGNVYADIMHKAFTEVMGTARIRDLRYDADNQTMHGYFFSPATGYSLGFKQEMDADLARRYYEKQNEILPILTYKVLFEAADNSISNQQLQLMEMKTLFEGCFYPAELSQEAYQPPVVSFRIQEKKVGSELHQPDLTLQNPVLQDRIKVESLRVRDKSLNARDDLADLIARLPQASVDEKKWLFAVGVENYRETEPVFCTLNSTEGFVQTAVKVLGIKDSHVEILKDQDATATLIKARLRRMLERVKAGDTVYFYFAGHGMLSPDARQGGTRKNPEYETYLLPYDGVPLYISSEPEMKITSIYKQLTDSRAEKVICFIDACFSGQSEYGPLLPKGEFAASILVPKEPSYDKTKMVLFSATDKGQTARSYKEKDHRLFSYFLIKSLIQMGNTNPSARELFDSFAENVSKQSQEYRGDYDQDPQISGNQTMLIK